MEEGVGITNFKSLKYQTGIEARKKQIEELVLTKMGKWKYSPDQIAPQNPNDLLERLKPIWDSSM